MLNVRKEICQEARLSTYFAQSAHPMTESVLDLDGSTSK